VSIYVDSHVVRLDIRVCVKYHIWLAQKCVCVMHMSIVDVDLDMVHLDMRPQHSVDMCVCNVYVNICRLLYGTPRYASPKYSSPAWYVCMCVSFDMARLDIRSRNTLSPSMWVCVCMCVK